MTENNSASTTTQAHTDPAVSSALDVATANPVTTINRKKLIINCIGDIFWDNHIVYCNESKSGGKNSSKDTMWIKKQPGGAGFTAALITKIVSDASIFNDYDVDAYPIESKLEKLKNIPSTISTIAKFSGKWRFEKYIGMQEMDETKVPVIIWKDLLYKLRESDDGILIIHDYRTYGEQENKKIINHLKTSTYKSILLRLSNLEKGSIFTAIQGDITARKKCSNLITFIHVNALRSNSIQVSQGLSWEKTTYDLMEAFKLVSTEGKVLNKKLEDFSNLVLEDNPECLRFSPTLIVQIDRFGYLLIKNTVSRISGDTISSEFETCKLIFYPWEYEENIDFSSNGEIFGFLISSMVHVIKNTVESWKKPNQTVDYEEALKQSLLSNTQIYEHGLNVVQEKTNANDDDKVMDFVYPFELVFKGATETYESPKIQDVHFPLEKDWNIIQDKYTTYKSFRDCLIHKIVENGLRTESLKEIPCAKISNLLTADREEIEQLHEMQKMIEDHFNKSKTGRPLSLLILGRPGSGKSFGLEQIIEQIKSNDHGDQKYEVQKYNLSQFKDMDIYDAFNSIRDPMLLGKRLLVFWDEIDTNDFYWTDYFLAPMQDGKYHEGSVEHAIGAPVFVFACSKSWDDLMGKSITQEDIIEYRTRSAIRSRHLNLIKSIKSIDNNLRTIKDRYLQQLNAGERSEKFFDWISRIHGYLNIEGLNILNRGNNKDVKSLLKQNDDGKSLLDKLQNPGITNDQFKAISKANLQIYVKRAILMRSILEKLYPAIFDKKISDTSANLENASIKIDKDLIDIFVFLIDEYKYGIRSFEALIQTSQLSGKRKFTKSSLPSPDQMKPHISDTDCDLLKSVL